LLARDVIYTSRAYATMSVSVCMRARGNGSSPGREIISRYASHCYTTNTFQYSFDFW